MRVGCGHPRRSARDPTAQFQSVSLRCLSPQLTRAWARVTASRRTTMKVNREKRMVVEGGWGLGGKGVAAGWEGEGDEGRGDG